MPIDPPSRVEAAGVVSGLDHAPVHGGHNANFTVNAETGDWHCFSQCGRGGDIFQLEMALAQCDFGEAHRDILRWVGRSINGSSGTLEHL